jgi:hypothetical protein
MAKTRTKDKAKPRPPEPRCAGCGRPSLTLYCDGCAPPPGALRFDRGGDPRLTRGAKQRHNGADIQYRPSAVMAAFSRILDET